MIVAVCRGGGIGFQGALPWFKSSRDMRFFSKMTSFQDIPYDNAVVMGRKTWNCLPAVSKPLKYRDNIIISRNKTDDVTSSRHESIHYISDIQEIREFANAMKYNVVWIIGGASIYAQVIKDHAIPIDEIYITFIDGDYKCDTYFPQMIQYKELAPTECSIWRFVNAATVPKIVSFFDNNNSDDVEYGPDGSIGPDGIVFDINKLYYLVEDVDADIISSINTHTDEDNTTAANMRFLRLKRLAIV